VTYLPLVGWLGFSALTIYCYAGGPFLFEHSRSPILYSYLAAVHLAILAGYRLAVKRYQAPAAHLVDGTALRRVAPWLVLPAVAGTIIGVVSNALTGITLDAALLDPDAARKAWIDSGGSLAVHLTVVCSIATYPLISTVLCYWRLCGRLSHWAVFVVIAGIVAYNVQGGARAGIFGVLAVATVCSLASTLSGRSEWKISRLAAVGSVGLAAFVLYSSFVTSNRAFRPIDDYAAFLRAQNEYSIDSSHYALDSIPRLVAPAVLSGYFYFGHGYEGLAMALSKPFIGSAWGFGHSAVLVRTAAKLSGSDDLYDLSYFYRLVREDGLSSSLWVTIYPWIASDLTFPGSVVFMGLLAGWLATAWLDVLNGRSVGAAWVLGWITFTVASTSGIFPPGDYGALISYWGSIVFWLRTRSHPRLEQRPRTRTARC
jgi:hypothetical protein